MPVRAGDPERTGGFGIEIRETGGDVADPRRTVGPDLDADLAHQVVSVARRRLGSACVVGHFVEPQAGGEQSGVGYCGQGGPHLGVERQFGDGGDSGGVHSGAFGRHQCGEVVTDSDCVARDCEHRRHFVRGSVECARRVVAVRSADRIGGIAGDAGLHCCRRVEIRDVSRVVHDHEGVLRRYGVQPVDGRVG